MQQIFKVILLAFLSGVAGSFFYNQFLLEKGSTSGSSEFINNQRPAKHFEARFTNHRSFYPSTPMDTQSVPVDKDFVMASANSTASVVYIKTTSEKNYPRSSFYDLFFEGRSGPAVSTGSGVIFRENGYIVTNNHVIDDADKIEVVHNKRTYQAEIAGTDPSTDIAVLKVKAQNLPAITLGNSKALKVGEWVLAVGNPFNLTSTVTAGIVSAKGREINILEGKFPIESFIQTDAAINPGNSGGALVNREGELVGINTAILSQTGSYSGYGFAVPVDIVQKVVNDIIEYGIVQKAFVGAEVRELNTEMARRLETDNLSGVVIAYLDSDGAAERAGLQKGDIILAIEGESIESKSEFEEEISYYSPGDRIKITYRRNNEVQSINLTLLNSYGETNIIKREVYHANEIGADLEKVPEGVKILKVKGGLLGNLGIEEGFIITAINQKKVTDPETVSRVLNKIQGRVIIEGINKRGVEGYYSFYL